MSAKTLPKRITSQEFYRALVAAGVIRDDESIYRIVIDIGGNSPVVVMYIERWADERLLDVVTTLNGVEIRGVSKETNDDRP